MHELQGRYKEQIDEMVSVCYKLAADKYVTSHGGNISWAPDRANGTIKSNILITPTKKYKGDITFEDICIINYKGKVIYAPKGGKPTGELPFHRLIFKERPDVASIVHAHPMHATSFAITTGPNYLAWPFLPEHIVELGPVCMVPYEEPLTDRLADNFKPFLPKFNAFLMENHGLTVIGNKGIERTRQLVDIVEVTAGQIIGAVQLGGVKPLLEKQVVNLEKTMETRNLPLPGEKDFWEKLTDVYAEAFEEVRRLRERD